MNNLKRSLNIVGVILLICLMIITWLPAKAVDASNGGDEFYIDIWTDKGGKGQKSPGGTYYVGEETNLYIYTNRDCRATLMIYVRPNIDYFNGITDLKAGTYRISIGKAEQSDIGLCGATFQASAYNEGQRIDSTSWNVVVAPTPGQQAPIPTQPPGESSSQSLPTNPPQGSEESYDTIEPADATELLALTALWMAEGKATSDPRMDADKDGLVTAEDARLILKWAVGDTDSVASQPNQPNEPTEGSDIQALLPTQDSGQQVATGSFTTDAQTLVGNWDMTLKSIQPEIPDLIPDILINQIIPERETWIIEPSNSNLAISYGSRSTWYKKTFLLKGLTEGSTTVLMNNQGSSYTFQTPFNYYRKSLPFPIGLIFSKITEIKVSGINSVNVSASGNNIRGTITVDNVQGTFLERENNGNLTTKQIHYSGTIIYEGVKK